MWTYHRWLIRFLGSNILIQGSFSAQSLTFNGRGVSGCWFYLPGDPIKFRFDRQPLKCHSWSGGASSLARWNASHWRIPSIHQKTPISIGWRYDYWFGWVVGWTEGTPAVRQSMEARPKSFVTESIYSFEVLCIDGQRCIIRNRMLGVEIKRLTSVTRSSRSRPVKWWWMSDGAQTHQID